MSTDGLVVEGLSVSFGAHDVVSAVDLSVAPGTVVGLIGANGAGKTTTIDAVSGFVGHTGSVRLADRDLTALRPHERARAGIGRTWQGIELFDDLTVGQNCLVAARRSGWRGLVSDLLHRPVDADVIARVEAALGEVGLADASDRSPAELSHGHQKLVGVARALAGAPAVLLLDEPAAGLDPSESAVFGSAIGDLAISTGIGVLLIDHDTRLIFEVCDQVVVLDFGKVVASGTVEEVRSDPLVIEAYLGVAP